MDFDKRVTKHPMKIFSGILVFGILGLILSFNYPTATTLRTGDIIFQSSMSGQSAAIQLATKSKFSHCGIIQIVKGKVMVLEAIGPVKLTSFKKWISHGDDSKYWVKRLKKADSILTPEVLKKMEVEGNKLMGKEYDLYFEWSDSRIYCSELVWKIYKQATGLELGKLQQLKEFDLSSKAVKDKLKERYGDKIPLEEKVISPVSIYNSVLLETIE